MHGLAMGNEVLKQLHKEVSLDEVDRLMDETREGIAYQQVSGRGSWLCLADRWKRLGNIPNLLYVAMFEPALTSGNRRGFDEQDEHGRRGSRASRAGGITAGSSGTQAYALRALSLTSAIRSRRGRAGFATFCADRRAGGARRGR